MFGREDAFRQALRVEAEQLNLYSEDETERLQGDKEDRREESPSILVRDEKIDNKSKEVISQEGGGVSPSDPEEARSEGVQRMRGLEEFGLGVPSKRRRIPTVKASENLKMESRRRAPKVATESTHMLATPACKPLAVDPHSPIQGNAVIKEETRPKRMRIPTQRAAEYLEMKRHSLSLKAAMRNIDMLTTPATCRPLAFSTGSSVKEISESKESGDVACTKDNDTPQVSSDNARNIESSLMQVVTVGVHSDGLSNLPIVNDNLAGLSSACVSGASKILQVDAAAQCSQGTHVEIPSLGNEGLVESGSATPGAATAVIMSSGIEKGNPKCNLKGKRNSRTASKSSWRLASFKPTTVDAEPVTSDAEPVTSERLIAYRQSPQSDHTINQRYQPIEYNCGGVYDPVTNLFDVDLMVKVSSRQKNAPFISVMSKVNNKPITGHALNTETLDDGFSDDLISGSGFYIGSSDEEEDAPVSQGASKVDKGKLNPSIRKIGKCDPNKPRKKVTFLEPPRYRESGQVRRKTRSLSSLLAAPDNQCLEEVRIPLITKAPVIYCVPIKLVFSRLNEALRS